MPIVIIEIENPYGEPSPRPSRVCIADEEHGARAVRRWQRR